MTEAFITPGLLRWARRRTFASVEVAAQELKVKPEKLSDWESGRARPTFRQAIELAGKLRVPFGYLFLSQPPEETIPLADLRTKAGAPPRKPSPDFLDVLYDALRKQEWQRDYLEAEGVDPLPFVGRFNTKSRAEDVAADIRQTLHLNELWEHRGLNRDNFYRELIYRSEARGIIVMRSGIVGNNTHRQLDAYEFQGFAISDKLAPLIFINQNDYTSSQIFTFAHELVHIWMGLSGVSKLDYFVKPAQQDHDDEKVTDAVAAEVLVPSETFDLRWQENSSVEKNLLEISSFYHVSLFVVLRRAYELDKITPDIFRAQHEKLVVGVLPRRKPTQGGGGYNAIFSRNSITFTTTLLYSLMEGKVSPTLASGLLNVRTAKLRGLETHLAERETLYA